MRQRGWITAVAVLLLAACSGGGGEADSTDVEVTSTAAAPSTSTTPTTTAAPTTTEEPTTTPAPTTQPPTSPPTTPPPTTAERDIVAEVTAAALAYDDWYVECLRNPPECDPSVVAVEGSDVFVNLGIIVDELKGAEFFVGLEDPGYTVIEGIDVLDDHVEVAVCAWGTMVLYGPPGPDGKPTVQNDTPSTVRETWQFVDQAGSWLIRRTDLISETEGVNECPPES